MSAVARILDDLKDRGGLQSKDIANITRESSYNSNCFALVTWQGYSRASARKRLSQSCAMSSTA